jgi:hypothetical protein
VQSNRSNVGGLCKFFLAPHTHAHGGNIVQHRLCGEKPQRHMEQTQNQTLTTKHNATQTLLCGSIEIATPKKNKT